jgi:hypothetical protein
MLIEGVLQGWGYIVRVVMAIAVRVRMARVIVLIVTVVRHCSSDEARWGRVAFVICFPVVALWRGTRDG